MNVHWIFKGIVTAVIAACIGAISGDAFVPSVTVPGIQREKPLPINPSTVIYAAKKPAGDILGSAVVRRRRGTEKIIEDGIDTAFRECFKQVFVRGQSLLLRIPFGMNGERHDASSTAPDFFGDGKALPDRLWPAIEAALDSEDARSYVACLLAPGEKTVRFDLASRSWIDVTPKADDPDADSGDAVVESPSEAEAPSETGNPMFVFLHKKDGWIDASDIYDYLYCLAVIGLDCSGFSYYMQKSIAAELGADLDAVLGSRLGIRPDAVPGLAGIELFTPVNGLAEEVPDYIAFLRPGDIILFRGQLGRFKHSAVIQSIDRTRGILRYVQCTDWAPRAVRGVHDSYLEFNPSRWDERLGTEDVRWMQEIEPAFPGELEPTGWLNDGDRYRNPWSNYGEGIVVRLKALKALIEANNPFFYAESMEFVSPPRRGDSLTFRK